MAYNRESPRHPAYGVRGMQEYHDRDIALHSLVKNTEKAVMTSAAPISQLQDSELEQLFPTPLLRHHWMDSDELNRELRSIVLARMEADQGKSLWHGSNLGGWHSAKELDAWSHPCIEELMRRVRALLSEMISRVVPDPEPEHFQGWSVQAWANVSRRGAKNASHVHSHEKSTVWSGIYYVDTGEVGESTATSATGLTKLEDRSGVPKEILRNPDPFEREVSIVPQPGLMVLFSSMLWHRVEPFLGEGCRITIAFNLSHPGFVIPRYSEPESAKTRGFKGWMWRNFRGLMLPASLCKRRFRRAFRPINGP